MMKNVTVLFCVLLVVILMSCRKEEFSVPVNSEILHLKSIIVDDEPYYQYSYNDSDLVVEESGKLDFTLNRYNAMNRLVSSDYFWNSAVLSTDTKAIPATLAQSSFVTAAGTRGATIKYEYDENDLLTKVIYTRTPAANSEYAVFSYDGNERISGQTLYWNNTETGQIAYSYDGAGNLTEEKLYDVSSTGIGELSSITRYSFDNKKNPFKSFRNLSIPGVFTNRNNIVKEVYTSYSEPGSGSGTVTVIQNKYEYNESGYPVSKNGSVRYEYE